MKYIFDDDKDIDDKYIIYIIACLIYFWQPEKKINKYGIDTPLPLNFDNVKLSTYVHDLFFKYIIKYSFNCFTIIPTTNHNVTCGAWQFITSIIQYLCYQNPSISVQDVSIVSPEYDDIEPKNDKKCEERMQNLFTESTQKLINFNLISFFQKDVSFLIDAAGKNRSVNYLSQTFIDILRNPLEPTKKFTLFKTSASLFDSAQPPNLETSMKKTDEGALIDSKKYTNNRTFIVKCGDTQLIKIKFIHKLEGSKDKYSIVFEQFFSDIPDPPYEVSQDFSSLVKSIGKFNETKNVFSLIGKSMGDFGQILFYYLLQQDSGYFSGTIPTGLTIFHTLDTWAASICSLFANGVICEESSDSLREDEGNLPYKFGNNKMFVSKTLKDKLINIMTPSIYLPTLGGAESYIDIWSKLPLNLGQMQEWSKLKAEYTKENLNLKEQLKLAESLFAEKDDQYDKLFEAANDVIKLAAQGYKTTQEEESRRAFLAIINRIREEIGEEKTQTIVDSFHTCKDQIEEKKKDLETSIDSTIEQIYNDSKKQPGSQNIATPPLANPLPATPQPATPQLDTGVTQHPGTGVSEPPTKMLKTGGGVMTRRMVWKQNTLNREINKSFDTIDEELTELKDNIDKAREALNTILIQKLPKIDVETGPISSRTRSQMARLKSLQQSLAEPFKMNQGGTKKTIKNKYKFRSSRKL
jgi:hypothetical protein